MAEPIYLQIVGHLNVSDGEDRSAAIEKIIEDIQSVGLMIDEIEETDRPLGF